MKKDTATTTKPAKKALIKACTTTEGIVVSVVLGAPTQTPKKFETLKDR